MSVAREPARAGGFAGGGLPDDVDPVARTRCRVNESPAANPWWLCFGLTRSSGGRR